MAPHPDFPESPYAVLDPARRWFPADEALRETIMEKLMPPLVAEPRRKVKEFRKGGYAGVARATARRLEYWNNPERERVYEEWKRSREEGILQ